MGILFSQTSVGLKGLPSWQVVAVDADFWNWMLPQFLAFNLADSMWCVWSLVNGRPCMLVGQPVASTGKNMKRVSLYTWMLHTCRNDGSMEQHKSWWTATIVQQGKTFQAASTFKHAVAGIFRASNPCAPTRVPMQNPFEPPVVW